MHRYHARRISNDRARAVKKAGVPESVLLLDTFNGTIVVEPVDRAIGDGRVLSNTDAAYELQPAWYLGPLTKLKEAWKRLGLGGLAPASS